MDAAQRLYQSENNLSVNQELLILQPLNDEVLTSLCTDVLVGNLESFEQLHAMLYPLFFSYTDLFIADEQLTDDLLLDEFFHCWQNWQFISSDVIKMTLLSRIRSRIVCVAADRLMESTANTSSVDIQLAADDFLRQYLLLSDNEIESINQIKVV
jgi:hypothetical protein